MKKSLRLAPAYKLREYSDYFEGCGINSPIQFEAANTPAATVVIPPA